MVCCNVLVDFSCSLFNWCWRYGRVPSEWRKSVIVPVPKRKRQDVCKVDDFHGISLTSVAYKAMCSMVHRRLVHMVEEKQLVAEEQGGFRKGRGCRDQLRTLVLLGTVESSVRKGEACQFHRL